MKNNGGNDEDACDAAYDKYSSCDSWRFDHDDDDEVSRPRSRDVSRSKQRLLAATFPAICSLIAVRVSMQLSVISHDCIFCRVLHQRGGGAR